MSKLVLALAAVALICRLVIINWTLPYPANPAHEHSMIYDSQAVVHDQFKTLYALLHFPAGLIADAQLAYWPVWQRYIATPPLLLWLAVDYGFNVQKVLAAPYVETAYKTLLVNRLISVIASIIGILLTWKLLRRFLSENLAFFLTAIFGISVSEIGNAIHEKTISLLTVMYLAEALFLERWSASSGKKFGYLAWAFLCIGLAGAAREYGLLFGGLLAGCTILFVLRRDIFKFIFSRQTPALVITILGGILIASPDILAELPYWAAAVLEPGGRSWLSTSFTTIPPELWAVGKLIFGGNIGVGIFVAAIIWAATMFRRTSPYIRALIVWILLSLTIFTFYPLKDLRFIVGIVPFCFLLIGLFLKKGSGTFFNLGYRTLLLILWLIEALLWSVSALVFFHGQDTRLRAAEEFNASVPTGTSVATFFAPYYNRQIPVDDKKFKQYTYDHLHSTRNNILYIPNGQGDDGTPGIWPEYILLDYEVGGYTYPSDQYSIHKFRSSILASQRYSLVKFYPKRTWQLGSYGLFGTKSRWLYFNPLVEVYKLN